MKHESLHPFAGNLETVARDEKFDIHKLNLPEQTVSTPDLEERTFQQARFAITEYFSAPGKNHESFVELKKFYEQAKAELETFLPKSFFVEGEPSGGDKGRSFYVVQKFDDPETNKSIKRLNELNSSEFSTEFIDRLLDLQERILNFLAEHQEEFPDDWLAEDTLDPKLFKEDIVYSPKTGNLQLANLFNTHSDLVKQISESTAGFESSKNRLAKLKMLGLTRLVEQINWALERSAAPEWIKGKGVHWSLDKAKLESEGKKAMALTFDDGPNDETEELLDILKDRGVKATFFLVGSQIAGREHIVQRIIDEGHDVGVHEWGQEGAQFKEGWKEYRKRFVGPRSDLGDVKKTTDLIEQVTGKRPTIGRVAGVHGTVDSLREFQVMGLEMIHGNPYDVGFMGPSKKLKAETLLKRALKTNGRGEIRIFHIGKMKDNGQPMTRDEIDFDKGEVYPPEETLKMIAEYIDRSQAQGYEFVPVKDYI